MRFGLKSVAWVFLLSASTLVASAQAPDNTKANRGDGQKAAVTAGKQNSNSSDLDVTKQIRSSIVKDKSLSTYAHNVKIVTVNGKVTLRGPVRSEDEKNKVAAAAAGVAGEANVTNELSVTPPKQ